MSYKSCYEQAVVRESKHSLIRLVRADGIPLKGRGGLVNLSGVCNGGIWVQLFLVQLFRTP